MRPSFQRIFAVTVLATAGGWVLAGAAAAPAAPAPGTLVILSTVDVKGKTGPCGCHIPKGGFARRATFVDSIRASEGAVMLVDGGGFFPETDERRDESWFQMDALNLLGVDAVGVGGRDLRFGISYLRETAKGKKLPLVCANLLDRKSKAPALAPSLIRKVGGVNVGVFGLISDKVDLGPSRDSLLVTDPALAAKATIAELRRKGAHAVLLLSQLGKVETEDLVAAVDGVDAVIVGMNVPLLQKGRMIKNTVACYGGEQGHYVGRTRLTFGADRKVTSGENETFVLGPEVADKPEILEVVRTFEDMLNRKLQKAQKETVEQTIAKQAEESPDRYLGDEACMRCHPAQAEHWKATAHAKAWVTLVGKQKEDDAACVSCHVVGYRRPGGFLSRTETPKRTGVGCESCHGMGTAHESWPHAASRVTEQVCVTCHDRQNDPTFDFRASLARVVH